jgi:hypothetical protein
VRRAESRPVWHGTAPEGWQAKQRIPARRASKAELEADLDVARRLIRAGVPVFAAPPAIGPDGRWNPTGGTGGPKVCGYWLPETWQKTVPTDDWLDR